MKGIVLAAAVVFVGTLLALPLLSRNDSARGAATEASGNDLSRAGARNPASIGDPRNIVVPEGFAVEEVYSPEQAGTVVAITFDSQGNLVIAREQGPIVTLFDTDGDGRFDREVQFSEEVGTSQGIFFDGPNLLVVGNGPQGVGLYRVLDTTGDSRGDRVELIARAWGTIGDHGPHAVFYGPDGYLYWTQGNGTGIFDSYHPLSPLRLYSEGSMNGRCDPRGHACSWRAPGGTFLRTHLGAYAAAGETVALPAKVEWELFAGGFRNQYDAAFNLLGELFTFDSDMEWDRGLPWFKGVSSVHVLPGGDHGWRSGSMNHPWHYIDILSPMEDLGRGSPTGVEALQTYNYPAEYWDMIVQADWSRGRIVGGRVEKSGATYRQVQETFVYGEPLNVTGLGVGPDGNLYFALGGRNTMGGIYRVVYTGSDAMDRPEASTPLDRVLTMIQPRAAYSRELARQVKAEMGGDWGPRLSAVVRDAQQPVERRVRALELLQVYGPEPSEELLESIHADRSWEIRGAAAYYLGMKNSDSARRRLVALTKDADTFVQRRALEGLLRTGIHPAMEPVYSAADDILSLLASPERFVRYQARHVLYQTRRALWAEEALALEGYPAAAEGLLAFVETLNLHSPRITEVTRALARGVDLLWANPSEEHLLLLLRPLQRAMLEDYGVTGHNRNQATPPALQAYNFERYGRPGPDGTPAPFQAAAAGGGGGGGGAAAAAGLGGPETNNAYQAIGELLLERFPARDTLVNREIVRTLAYLETPGAVEKISLELDNPGNSREQQIFYADQLGFIQRNWDEASVERLAGWLERVYREGWRGGASFVQYIDYTHDALLDRIVPPAIHASVAQRLEAARPQLATTGPGGGGGGGATLVDEEIFETLVYNPGANAWNVDSGVAAMERAACLACHTFGPIGTAFGPDLTTSGQRYTRLDLVRKIMYPHETVGDQYPAEEITRTNGQTLIGIVVGEEAGNVRLQLNGVTVINIPNSEIESRRPSDRSVMPAGLISSLSGPERTAIIALLQAGPEAIPDSTRARVVSEQ